MIDFHCHIFTPGSYSPHSDGRFFQTLKPLAQSGQWIGAVWQESIETIAETWRSPTALKHYAQMSPLIYSEMSRRLFSTTANRLTLEMAHHRVRQAVVVGLDPYVPTPEVVQACVATKGVLLPFGSVDPHSENWRESLQFVLALPILGFKLHDQLQEVHYGDERILQILTEVALARPGLPVYLHTGSFPIYKPISMDWSTSLPRLLAMFPTLRFVCGHCGWNRPSLALRAARKYGNLWLETSWQPPNVLRRLCDALGPQRLLMGSDYPLFSMRRAVSNCRAALSESEFRKVSEENARALLDQTAPISA